MTEALIKFFNGRSISYDRAFGGWHWIDSEGYDGGWTLLTDEELETFKRLLKEA